jgi:carbon storage regulator
MLILMRKPGEEVVLGNDIFLSVVEVRGKRVWLGIDAPDQVRIVQAELLWRQEALAGGNHALPATGVTAPAS